MIIDNKLIDEIESRAKHSPRLRMNYNFHESAESKAQRLLNVLLPGTELPIHRHTHSDETYILVKGKMDVIFYNDNKEEVKRFSLDPLKFNYGIHIPKNQWHGIEVFQPSTIFEVKDGPYTPLNEDNILK